MASASILVLGGYGAFGTRLVRLLPASDVDVRVGDLVRRGDPIGRAQRLGGENSSHFVAALSFHGLAIDPWFAMMR